MTRLIHLNGAPGVGKSTLARRYADARPGTFLCDIDVLRTWIAGWEDDFQKAGARIRTTAIAAISAYLATGADVVLPQLVGRAEELARFRAAAEAVDATYVGIVLVADPDVVVQRFRGRSATVDDPLTRTVTSVVDALGGDDAIRRACVDLDELARKEGLIRVTADDPASSYDALVAAVGAP